MRGSLHYRSTFAMTAGRYRATPFVRNDVGRLTG